jgi:SAM-dependent methyltransferase
MRIVNSLLVQDEILLSKVTQIEVISPQSDTESKVLPCLLDNIQEQGVNSFSLMVGIFLSETNSIDSGNFTVFPKGHLALQDNFRNFGVHSLYRHRHGRIITPNLEFNPELQFLTNPGDIILCHHQVPYRSSINLSPNIKMAVFFRFYNKKLPLLHPTQCNLRYYALTNLFKVGWSKELSEMDENECKIHENICRCNDSKGNFNIQDVLTSNDLSIPFILDSKSTASLKQWTDMRKFIADIFHRDGSILDIGCANGFLLACFQYWSSFNLIPYGIECDSSIYKSEVLFPSYYQENHFVHIDLLDFIKDPSHECPFFPLKFDFIYWNIWTSGFDLESEKDLSEINFIKNLLNPNGRLILGFYGPKENSMRKIEILRKNNIKLNTLKCPHENHPHIVAWYTNLDDSL